MPIKLYWRASRDADQQRFLKPVFDGQAFLEDTFNRRQGLWVVADPLNSLVDHRQFCGGLLYQFLDVLALPPTSHIAGFAQRRCAASPEHRLPQRRGKGRTESFSCDPRDLESG